MTCKLVCKPTQKKPRKFTAKDVGRIITAARLNDSIENICQAIKQSKIQCDDQKIDCHGIKEKITALRKKLEEKRGKQWFTVVKVKIDALTGVDSGFWGVVNAAPKESDPNKPVENESNWFDVNDKGDYDNDPTVIDDQGNIVSGRKQSPYIQKVGWFLDVRWIYKLYEALQEIFSFLPSLNIFKGLFNFVDILLDSLKQIEEWLEQNCE